jgi:two-component sensor histidine kinase
VTGPRLLYIDDDPGLGRFVQRQLEQQGYEVHLATDAAAGLVGLTGAHYDAVALAHCAPGQDGLRVLDGILALPDPPPVIFVTGTSESRIAVAALKAGAADYVVKDVGGEFVELLDAAVRSAMARVQLRRENAAAEQEIRDARDRFEALAAERHLLMQEANHRVGNSLQLVAAFLHIQASSSTAPETRAALAEANRRVLAIAQVHRRLYASDDMKFVALGSYLGGLIEDIRLSTDAEGIGDLLSLETDEVMIDADDAVSVGIIVTELVINAMKHAYPGSHGPIRVRLKWNGSPGRYLLSVEDEGVGKGQGDETSVGLGGTIIKAMASRLDSEVRYDTANPGTRASMEFHVAPPAADRASLGSV